MTLTYVEVGATRAGPLPTGYRYVLRRARVGHGRAAFDALSAGMRAWGIHRSAGLRVREEGPPAVGRNFASGLGVGALRLWGPCRVVWLDDEPERFGYGFGTRAGHAERGEEGMVASLDADGTVWFTIRAFSRPAVWYARLAGPLGHFVQDRVTDRYVGAARQLAAS